MRMDKTLGPTTAFFLIRNAKRGGDETEKRGKGLLGGSLERSLSNTSDFCTISV